MNIIGFSASPRPEGSTAWAVDAILEGAWEHGAKVRSWSAAGLDLQPCRACFACRTKDRRCVIQDDMPRVHASLLEAQALVLGVPIFMSQMSAQAKIFVDRLHPLFAPRFSPTFQKRNAGKALVLAFVQGNPDPELFRIYVNYTCQTFRTLEFDVRESVVVAGTRSALVQEQDALHARLKAIGATLAS
ncbi:NADPH-dependent FMN reductase [Telmatospirillum siberiense]|uniref:NADPH-dependent FMN reductase n=1 Tax=Telmatospirillum siberiense TaxID=382514 RepID=A0A2N3PSM2_9PROT|nr:NADPH-dependent FMN reductase [Telmatospirillum siberiense]